MSRGPGKWQRIILDALKQQSAVYLLDLLLDQDDNSRSNYVALHRAAVTLFEKGQIEFLIYFNGRPRVLLHGAGSERPAKRPRSKYRSYAVDVTEDVYSVPTRQLQYAERAPLVEDESTDPI
jgi:hypothetical protein